jgi:hypothetical protein
MSDAGRKSMGGIRKGATTVEMTLVGIPIIFIMISIFEISRGMWIYDTAAHAVREGVRFATVHGVNCVNNPPTITNNCGKTVADVAQVIRNAGIGLDPTTTTVWLTAPSPGGAVVTCTLTACAADTSTWPPVGSNDVGTIIQIDISTPFTSALAMFWPGAAMVNFTTANLGATSLDAVQF